MTRLPSLAVRNVGRNRRRSIITAITIVFGVAMVLVMRGVTSGMSDLMTADVVQGRSGALQIHRTGYVDNVDAVPTSLNMVDAPELRAQIRAIPHVTGVTPRIQFSGLVSNGIAQTMFIGRGIDVATESQVCPRAPRTIRQGGASLAEKDTNHILLGSDLGDSFGLAVGQTVNLQTSSPSGRANALDLSIRGFSTSSFPFENKRVVIVPLATAQALLGLEGRVTEFAVAIDDLRHLDDVADALRTALGPDYEVHSWGQMQPFVRDLINRQNFILATVGFILFFIVLTGIMNTMLMSVFERVREIGTLLAVGVRRSQVMAMFLIEAGVIGFLGGLAGAVLGRTVIAVLSIRGIPITLSGTSGFNVLRPTASLSFTLLAIGVALGGALAAAAWPAFRASRLNPVDALRG